MFIAVWISKKKSDLEFSGREIMVMVTGQLLASVGTIVILKKKGTSESKECDLFLTSSPRI